MVSPELLGQIDSLELRARMLVESVLTGAHRGKQRGFSVDFSEHRDYSPGDDVRFLDWKLYGRRDRFYVRQFEDENQLLAYCLVDTSGSMKYRSKKTPLSKLEYAASLAAAIGWIACYQNDRSALTCFDGDVASGTGPVFGHAGARLMIAALESERHTPEGQHGEDEYWKGLSRAIEIVPARSIVFIMSDLFGDLRQLRRLLTRLRRMRCETRIVHVIDPAERSFPFEGHVVFRDLEGGEEQVVSTQLVKQEYVAEFQRFLDECRQLACACRSDYVLAETSQSVGQFLRLLLPSRHKQ